MRLHIRALNAWLRRLGRKPHEIRWRWAERLGWLYVNGDPVFREVLFTNLRLCVARDDAECMRLARRNVTETFFSWLDRFRVWELTAAQTRHEISLDGMEHLDRHRGQPVVLLCPHFLSMEAAIQRLALEVRTVALYRPAADRGFEAMRCKARSRFNAQILVDATAPLLPVVRQVAAGMPLFVLPDLDGGEAAHEFVPFFGTPAATARTVAWFARRLCATVIPFTCHRTNGDHVRAQLHPPLNAPWEDERQALAMVNQFIEGQIAHYPEQYWWAHPRFATRPPGAPSIYSAATLRRVRDEASAISNRNTR
jgi:KDO2-lipid IV(A) lauroyltransferase